MARKPAPEGADRRQLIMEAALDVFAEQGFEGATTKEIAARAGVTHGLIYFYFASKEDLFQAAFEHTLRSALDDLSLPDAGQTDDDPEVVIERSIYRLLDTLNSPRASSLSRLMMRMAANGDRKAGPLRECKVSMKSAISAFTNTFATFLDAQIARGRLRPVNTHAVVTLLIGGVIASFRVDEQCSDEGEEARAIRAREWARAYSDILLSGLSPRPARDRVASAIPVAAPADP